MGKYINKKNLIIGGFLIFILLIIIIALINNGANSNAQIVGSGDNFRIPTTQKVRINNNVVNNFYKDPTYLYKQGSVVIDENTVYQIAYIANNEQFIISIYQNDNVSKGLAEQAFLKKLAINESIACKLNTLVQVYTDSNDSALPQITRFSFCK